MGNKWLKTAIIVVLILGILGSGMAILWLNRPIEEEDVASGNEIGNLALERLQSQLNQRVAATSNIPNLHLRIGSNASVETLLEQENFLGKEILWQPTSIGGEKITVEKVVFELTSVAQPSFHWFFESNTEDPVTSVGIYKTGDTELLIKIHLGKYVRENERNAEDLSWRTTYAMLEAVKWLVQNTQTGSRPNKTETDPVILQFLELVDEKKDIEFYPLVVNIK